MQAYLDLNKGSVDSPDSHWVARKAYMRGVDRSYRKYHEHQKYSQIEDLEACIVDLERSVGADHGEQTARQLQIHRASL